MSLSKKEYLFGVPVELVGTVKRMDMLDKRDGRPKKIHVKDLIVDRKSKDNPNGYQRQSDLDRALDIANTYTKRSMRMPIVSKRKGSNKYYVIDGQHTIMAMILLGMLEFEMYVLDSPTTQEEESKMFSDCNAFIKGVSSTLKFANQFTQGVPLIMNIDNILTSNNFKCVWDIRNSSKDSFVCETKLVALYKHDEGDSLRTLLNFMDTTWGADKADRHDLVRGSFITGLFEFFTKYTKRLDTADKINKFSKKCKRYTAKTINKDSTQGVTNKYENTFKALYNYGIAKISDKRIE